MDALHTAYAGYSFIGRERLPVLAGGLSDLDDFSTDAVAVVVLIDLGMFTIIDLKTNKAIGVASFLLSQSGFHHA